MSSIKKAAQKGFTLVELSIVLIIIGLIVGGVLVGQDLIEAAKIRSAVNKLQQYDVAVATFRTKYFEKLAGDLTADQAQRYGINPSQAGGNDNGRINDVAGNNPIQSFDNGGGEPAILFDHLSAANMIPGRFSANVTVTTAGTPPVTTVTPATGEFEFDVTLPKVHVGAGGIVPTSYGIGLYWIYGVDPGVNGGTDALPGVVNGTAGSQSTGTPATANAFDLDRDYGLTPLQASGFDSKLDDNNPSTGVVVAIMGLGADGAGPDDIENLASADVPGTAGAKPNPLVCIIHADGAPADQTLHTYNIATENTVCTLSIRSNGW